MYLFSSFPRNPEISSQWIARISRQQEDGKPWQPTKYSKVCSEHFNPSDFYSGLATCKLREEAVPSQNLGLSIHKEASLKRRSTKRKPPAEREFFTDLPNTNEPLTTSHMEDHNYHQVSIEAHLEKLQNELKTTKRKLKAKNKELKCAKRKVCRRESRIEDLLKDLERRDLLKKDEVDLLSYNFDQKTLFLIENELKSLNASKNNARYSQEVKSFATTLHFYSAQAYQYVRRHLHLPHPDTIRKWSTSLNVEPGFLSEVVDKLKNDIQEDPDMSDCVLMFDSMGIKKEVIYNKHKQCYAGFVDMGNIINDADEQLASESLVFLVVGL